MNPYKTLDLPKDATPADIERAYKRAAKRTHPDAGGSAAKFNEVKRSRDLLLDPRRRAHYDQTGDASEPPPQNANEHINLIMEFVMRFVQASASGAVAHDISEFDFLEHLRGEIKKSLEQAKQKRAYGAKMVQTLREIEKRTKARKGRKPSPVLAAALTAQAATIDRELSVQDKVIERHEKAIGLLADFNFDFNASVGQRYTSATGWQPIFKSSGT